MNEERQHLLIALEGLCLASGALGAIPDSDKAFSGLLESLDWVRDALSKDLLAERLSDGK